MSLFRPFARRTAQYRANVPIEDQAPVPEAPAEPVPPPVAPAPEPAPVPTSNVATPTPVDRDAANSIVAETENRLRGELREEWSRAVDTLNTASRMVEALSDARRRQLVQGADLVAEVAATLAERAIRSTLAVSPLALAEIVRSAAESLPSDPVKIRIPPADVERLGALLPAKLAGVLEADPSVEAGCIAETQRASVDATVDAMVEGIQAAIDEWKSERDAT